jgi:hypothetical protein
VDEAWEVEMVQSVELLLRRVGYIKFKKDKVKYLKNQFEARVTARKWSYPNSAIGPSFRTAATKKLTMATLKGKEELQYLQDLLSLMLKHDSMQKRSSAAVAPQDCVFRNLPQFRLSTKILCP